MPRLCVDCLMVTRMMDRFTVTSRIIAPLLSYTLLITPVWAVPSSSLGTVVYADRAHVGAAQTSVGAPFLAATGSAPNNPEVSRSAPAPLACSFPVRASLRSLRNTPTRPQRLLLAPPLFQPPVRMLLPCMWLLR